MPDRVRQAKLPRNVWIVSITSFLTDVSSEMIINALPLFLSNILHVKTNVIGLIEGVAEAGSSILKIFSGWISDRLRMRKALAVLGYAVSTLSKPIFLLANSWGVVAAARWGDRVGKGIRTAPRDALLADSVPAARRGFAFGLHRAADTAGAFLGLSIALWLVHMLQGQSALLRGHTFRVLVLASLLPAALAVIILAWGSREVAPAPVTQRPAFAFNALGGRFSYFMLVMCLFELGNSADAFLILRAQERGLSIYGIFAMLIAFNFVYTIISTPAGRLSDRIGRRPIIVAGWIFYALVYLGFALAVKAQHIVALYVLYGCYYGLTTGVSKAFIADIVPADKRGLAFGTYHALTGICVLPASLIAGVLWSGIGAWSGFGPQAPFFFGSALAILAAMLFVIPRSPKAEHA